MDVLREIWDAILRNKMRTIATGMAVSSGLFLLIVLLGASNGIINTFTANSRDAGLNIIRLYPGWTSKPYRGRPEGREIQLHTKDLHTARSHAPEHQVSTTAEISQSGLVATVGKNHVSANIEGVFPESQEGNGIKLKAGRFINQLDMMEHRKSIIIGEDHAELLFGKNSSAIGQPLAVSNVIFQVVGVMEHNSSVSSSPMLAPFPTVQTLYTKGDTIDYISIKTQGLITTADNKTFENGITKVLARSNGFDPTDPSALWIDNSTENNVAMAKATNMLHTSFWVLGLLTLLSGITGVGNIMLITVRERTHEFGIRKALGAKPWNIIWMVMAESILITTLFGYFGMLLGIGFCEWMDKNIGGQTMDIGVAKQQYFINPTVGLDICAEATLVMILAGAIAGFIPAWRAAKVKPIEALRG